jgi:CheY-like chemotaxis protein
LPGAAPASVTEAEAGAAHGIVAGARSVLLVDDEADVRATIAAVLRELDYRVVEAADGSAALDCLIGSAAVDLVICDIAMPGGLNGVDIAREAKRLRPGVKVLLISGDPNAAIQTAPGAPEFPRLSKPFRETDLMRELAAMMSA